MPLSPHAYFQDVFSLSEFCIIFPVPIRDARWACHILIDFSVDSTRSLNEHFSMAYSSILLKLATLHDAGMYSDT
jgi:hypothetical protein